MLWACFTTHMTALCTQALGCSVQLLVSIKGPYLLVFQWLILAAECAGDPLVDTVEEKPVERNTWRNAPGMGIQIGSSFIQNRHHGLTRSWSWRRWEALGKTHRSARNIY